MVIAPNLGQRKAFTAALKDSTGRGGLVCRNGIMCHWEIMLKSNILLSIKSL